MAVYPESLVKISAASIHHDTNDALKGQNLRQWAKDFSKYKETYIVGVSIPNGEVNGDNDIIPAYDFIEKVADAVVLEFSELKNALASSDIKNIFISKDITMTEDVTITSNKAILGINSILNLNGKTITLGGNKLEAYCTVDGTCTITGTGTVWFKDVLCSSNNTSPITADANITKGFERFVDKSNYYTTYKPTGWTQKFVDNTFPWNDIIKKINDDIAAERTARSNSIQAEATARSNEDTRLAKLISDEASTRADEDTRLADLITEEETRAKTAESVLGDRITNETNARTSADTALRNRMDALVGGEDGKYVYGVGNDFTALTKNVDTSVAAKAIEDYAVPTVKAVKDYVDGIANRVYKPKGNKTVADIKAYAPAASNLGEVYNIIGITTKTIVNLTDSASNPYTIEVEPDEDVGCVNIGTDAEPVYRWNDFGGKIDLSDYYTKIEVDAKATAATTSIANTNNDNIEVTSSGGSGGVPLAYHIHANVESISVNTNVGLNMTTGTAANHTTTKTISLDLANDDDVAACVALFNNL